MRPTPLLLALSALLLAAAPASAALSWLEQIHPDVFAKMREVERYQMKIAEKHYLKGEYKIALAEYEKYITLYEKSDAASYAQLMWSHCQLKLRHSNTAIRDGFQSVIDYWPTTYDAIRAGYLIADTYRQMGEVENAERAYRKVINDHEKHYLATLCRTKILEMAKIAKDEKKIMQLLFELAFETERNAQTLPHAIAATKELASLQLRKNEITSAIETLETTYEGEELMLEFYALASGVASGWVRSAQTRARGVELSEQLISSFERYIPTLLDNDEARAKAKDYYYKITGILGWLGRDKEVLATYNKMLKILGQSDEILGRIAAWYKSQNQREHAYATYRKFANKDEGLRNIATMLVEDERYDQAFSTYGQLSDKDEGLVLTAELQLMLGKWEEAIATFMQLSDEVEALGYVATTYRSLSKWDDAIKTYQELIIKNTAGINDYMWAIGECYESSERLHEAIRTYRQVDRFPTNYFKAASLHRRLKEFKEAILLYQQCKVVAAKAPEASTLIAQTYEQAGERENAINSYRLICKSYPKTPHASRAHAHLQSVYKITVTLGGAKEE